jgi:hypothetical protein
MKQVLVALVKGLSPLAQSSRSYKKEVKFVIL